MKWIGLGLILAGIGNTLLLPLYLIQPFEISFALALGGSVLGLISLAAGFGTWSRKIWGWKTGFAAIIAASLWCAGAAWESIMGNPRPSIIIASVAAGIFLLGSLFFCGWWGSKRPWFEITQTDGVNQAE